MATPYVTCHCGTSYAPLGQVRLFFLISGTSAPDRASGQFTGQATLLRYDSEMPTTRPVYGSLMMPVSVSMTPPVAVSM